MPGMPESSSSVIAEQVWITFFGVGCASHWPDEKLGLQHFRVLPCFLSIAGEECVLPECVWTEPSSLGFR